MPPERMRGGLTHADARGDVYALGVSLYELLALRLPFEGETIQELMDAVISGEHAPLRQRNNSVPVDASIVCATAMERDPARRYPTAEAFARDLRNLLELRPIDARPPTKALRARRWVQRHPTVSLGTALGFLLLVVAPSVGWWRVRAERDVAVRELSVRREMLAFFVDLFKSANPEGAGYSEDRTVHEVAEEGSRRIRATLGDTPEVRGPLVLELASVQNALGKPREALELAREGLELAIATAGELSVESARARIVVGGLLTQLGEYDEAEELLSSARRIALAHGDPQVLDPTEIDFELAAIALRGEHIELCLERLAGLEHAGEPSDHRDTVLRMTWLGLRAEVANAQGDFEMAERCYGEVLAMARQAFGDEHHMVTRHTQNLGVARNAFGRSLELCRRFAGDSFQTAKAAGGMGSALCKAGDYVAAERALREALDLSRRFIPRRGVSALEAPMWLARCLVKLERSGEAAPLYEEALACFDEEANGQPRLAAKLEGELADVLDALGRADEAALHRERQAKWLAQVDPSAK